jgi:hypothetical protein
LLSGLSGDCGGEQRQQDVVDDSGEHVVGNGSDRDGCQRANVTLLVLFARILPGLDDEDA